MGPSQRGALGDLLWDPLEEGGDAERSALEVGAQFGSQLVEFPRSPPHPVPTAAVPARTAGPPASAPRRYSSEDFDAVRAEPAGVDP